MIAGISSGRWRSRGRCTKSVCDFIGIRKKWFRCLRDGWYNVQQSGLCSHRVNTMSTITTTLPPGPPPGPIARFTVEQYHAMIEAGIFANDEAVELLEGWLVQKMAKKRPHSRGTRR